jgi:hypothetical protein
MAAAHSLPPDAAHAEPQSDRAETNRQNAQHSTGPVTPEGKDAVRLNALKSGIYAETVLLPGDDAERYHSLGENLKSDYGAETAEELELLQSILDNHWRHRRLSELDKNLYNLGAYRQRGEILATYVPYREARFNYTMDDCEVDAVAESAGFAANHRLFEKIWRQQGRLQRQIDKDSRRLEQLIADRKARKADEPAPAPSPDSGFVPPKSENPAPTASAPHEPSSKSSLFEDVPPHILARMPNFVGKTAEKHQIDWLRKHRLDA